MPEPSAFCLEKEDGAFRRRGLKEEIMFEQPVLHEVWECISKLKPKYRVVVYLFYYEGYVTKEIAEILHISNTAVTTRLSRTRQYVHVER